MSEKTPLSQLLDSLKELHSVSEAARAAINAQNRAKTKAKKWFPVYLQEQEYEPGTIIQIDNEVAYKFDVAEHNVVDPKEWHKKWQSGEITETQYFAAITVGKDEAKLYIGDDQVAMICRDVKGKTVDVRSIKTEELKPLPKGREYVIVSVSKKKAPAPAPAPAPSGPKLRRNITVPVRRKP
jgi:hypothetical protein